MAKTSSLSLVTSIALYSWFLVTPTTARVGPVIPCPADPFIDPKHDPCNPLKYIASDVLTGIAFALVLLVGLTQSLWMWKWGARWMLAMTIGAYTFALGIGTRFGLHTQPDAKGLYIVEYLFVVLSPCAFIAANYVLLGHLARYLRCDEYLLVKPRKITRVFISSDITTFLIQAAGGALSISANDIPLAKTGSHIFLAGLVLQLVSFLVFTCIYLVFLYRVYTLQPQTWIADKVRGKGWFRDWRALAGALCISCIGILIRSVYRTIELSQGFEGALATNEGLFYGLDTLPLFLCIAIYVPFWPGRFIPKASTILDIPSSPSPTVPKEGQQVESLDSREK